MRLFWQRVIYCVMMFLNIVIILAFLSYLIGLIWIDISRYEITASKIPKSFDGYTILQLSDLHSRNFGENPKSLLDKINKENPDIIVLTGDMINTKDTNFSTFYNLAEKHQADIAVCSSRKVDDEGNITETRNPNSPLNLAKIPLERAFSYKDFPDDIFSLTSAMPWNKLFKNKMLKNNQLTFPELTGPDDLCFVYMALVCAEKIVAIDDEFINYRHYRPGSAFTYRANSTINIIRVALHLKKFLEQKNLYTLLEKAYLKSLFSSIRWEINLCNDEQYKNFLTQLKTEFPDDWKLFSMALRMDFLTLDYLHKFIGNNKVYLWGASNFLKNLLEKEKEANPNILGIIDKNEASWGKDFENYKIYSPEILKQKPADVLVTIYNNYETVYKIIKDELKNSFPNIKVLDNIFESGNND